jgi:hypothetical protein
MVPHPQTGAGWRTCPGVFAAAVGEDLVFLHLPTDRYLCLPEAARDVRTAAGALVIADSVLAADLSQAGLVERGPPRVGPGPGRAGELVGRPRSSAVPEAAGRLRLHDLPELLRATADVAASYRRRPLAELLVLAERGRSRLGACDRPAPCGALPPGLAETVARFHRWRPYAPVPAKCLVRSFMLLRLLQRRGFDALWVFGVATWPFRAHCWLQLGDVVLDDDVERLASYTPILVV